MVVGPDVMNVPTSQTRDTTLTDETSAVIEVSETEIETRNQGFIDVNRTENQTIVIGETIMIGAVSRVIAMEREVDDTTMMMKVHAAEAVEAVVEVDDTTRMMKVHAAEAVVVVVVMEVITDDAEEARAKASALAVVPGIENEDIIT